MEMSHAGTPDRKRGDRETAALALLLIAEIYMHYPQCRPGSNRP
jgi:hypothetical protein